MTFLSSINSFLYSGFGILISISGYVFSAYCFSRIGAKLGVDKRWLAWIPLVNIFFILKLAGKSYWSIFWGLVPIANIIFIIIWFARIARRLNKSRWHGVVLLLPIISTIDLAYLAFSNSGTDAVPPSLPPSRP